MFNVTKMTTLRTQYLNFIQESKKNSDFKSEEEVPSFESWIENKFKDSPKLDSEFYDWDVTLLDGIEED
ncbi:hypothetical protein EBU91_05090 [bacterium]|jgi:hypothetical protein|nr:hypothetical protein [bacterium]